MENNKRREFLKKVAYKAPAILVLGTLVAPASVSGTANSKITVTPFGSSSNNNDNSGNTNGGFGSN